MTEPRSTASPSPQVSPRREADPLLLTAVRELFSGLRAGAADVADLVAAEARVALRLLVAMTISAVGAVVLGVFALVGLVSAAAAELIARGLSPALAIATVAVLCLAASAMLGFQLRSLSRRALFGRSREQLRGGRTDGNI